MTKSETKMLRKCAARVLCPTVMHLIIFPHNHPPNHPLSLTLMRLVVARAEVLRLRAWERMA